jgi:hypothetical protein
MTLAVIASTARALVVPAAMVRVAAGAAFLVTPALAGRAWIGKEAAQPGAETFAQALGARDALIGLGALLALREGQSPRWWILAGAASDAVDALATLLHFAGLPRGRRLLVAAIAGSSAIGYAWLAMQSTHSVRESYWSGEEEAH